MEDTLDNPYIALEGIWGLMPVKVLLHSRIRDVVGQREIELDPPPGTVGDLVLELVNRFGPKFSQLVFRENATGLRDNVVILVNGHSIKMLRGMETSLAVGDKVTADTLDILELVGGG